MAQRATDDHDPQPPAAPRPEYRLALAAVEAELHALAPRELVTLKLDVPAAVLVAITAVPGLRALRPAVVAQLGEVHARAIDRLELVASAAMQAHARYLALASPVDLRPISARVVETRNLLLTDVQALVNRGLIPASALAQLAGVKGYSNQWTDVLQLVSALRAHWPAVEPVTPLVLEDLDRAEAVAKALAVALGERDQPVAEPAADLRRRALTLLVSTYDDVRRVIGFLRWREGDADEIAPSLYTARKRRSRVPEAVPEATDAPGAAAPAATADEAPVVDAAPQPVLPRGAPAGSISGAASSLTAPLGPPGPYTPPARAAPTPPRAALSPRAVADG